MVNTSRKIYHLLVFKKLATTASICNAPNKSQSVSSDGLPEFQCYIHSKDTQKLNKNQKQNTQEIFLHQL